MVVEDEQPDRMRMISAPNKNFNMCALMQRRQHLVKAMFTFLFKMGHIGVRQWKGEAFALVFYRDNLTCLN